MRKILSGFILIAVCVYGVKNVYAATKGTVELTEEQLFQSDGYYCGYVKNKWIPGRMLSTTTFYSHAAERKNILSQYKKASGKKKASLQKKAQTLQKQIRDRAPTCEEGPDEGADEGGSTPLPTPTSLPTSTPSTNPLRFNLTSAVGLALGSASASSFDAASVQAAGGSSNMKKVKGDGSVEEVVSSGKANIRKFLIAPNDKLYVLFNLAVNLDDTSITGSCLLAEVDKATGTPTCIDSEAVSIEWLDAPRNKPIQFDASGAIYYLARGSSGNAILRKYSGGTHSDLINQNITINDFLVLNSGAVLIYGYTNNTNTRWLRKITTSGGLETIKNVQNCNNGMTFMKLFPDGKIYVGIDDCTLMGVYRMSMDSSSLDNTPWIAYGTSSPIAFDCNPSGLGNLEDWLYNCGTRVDAIHTTPSQKVFGITTVGWNNLRKTLVKYYDSYARPTTLIKDVKVFQTLLSNIILAGLDNDGKNVMTIYDISGNSETQLIGPSNEIEVYHVNYVSAENKIMFDGLRFSDNKYVIGQYDLNSMTLSASQTGSTKLEDFQTF